MLKNKRIKKHYATVHISMHPVFKERLLYEAEIAGITVSTYIKHILLDKWGCSYSVSKRLTRPMINELKATRKALEEEYLYYEKHYRKNSKPKAKSIKRKQNENSELLDFL
jgi:hypothetical protein